MSSGAMNPKADAYFKQAKKWQEEMKLLRKLLLGCHLTEDFKWSKPCYRIKDGNVVILLPLKNYCALLFCKGALLKDTAGLLIKAGENTQAARQIRFTTLDQITKNEAVLRGYIRNAVEVEKAGLEVEYKKPTDFVIPEELQRQFDKTPALRTAFHALTPGRQRGYFLFISAAKQSKTRAARIEKCRPLILKGKGLNDDR